MITRVVDGPVTTLGGLPLQPYEHLCAFYRGRLERDELMYSHLREGLSAGHVCLCLAAAGERDAVLEVLAAAEPDLDLGLLDVSAPPETYLRTGAFEPDCMLQVVDDWSRTTFGDREGQFARVIVDMSWALPLVSASFVGDLSGCGDRATHWVRSYPQTCVHVRPRSLRGRRHHGGDQGHSKVLMSGLVVENPYFVDPVQVPGQPRRPDYRTVLADPIGAAILRPRAGACTDYR